MRTDLQRHSRPTDERPQAEHSEMLRVELMHRMAEFGALQAGWDGPRARKPAVEVIKHAGELGLLIVGWSNPMPHALNLGATPDGHLLFSLDGFGGRRADLWVEDATGRFSYVATDGDKSFEDDRPIASYPKFAEWLAGRAQNP